MVVVPVLLLVVDVVVVVVVPVFVAAATGALARARPSPFLLLRRFGILDIFYINKLKNGCFFIEVVVFSLLDSRKVQSSFVCVFYCM